jgi:hypothetical protein
MLETMCRKCGERYPLGQEHVCKKRAEARKDTPRRNGIVGRAPVAVEQEKLPTTAKADTRVPKADDGKPRKPLFDRNTYQREYMKGWRARQAAKKASNQP